MSEHRKPAITEVVVQQAKFSVAMDTDRPTEIPMIMTIYPARNNRGKPRVDLCFRYGKAKRHEKPPCAVLKTSPKAPLVGRVSPKHRKAN